MLTRDSRLAVTTLIIAIMLVLLGSTQSSSSTPLPQEVTPLLVGQGPARCPHMVTMVLPSASLEQTTLFPAAVNEGFEGAWPSSGWQVFDRSSSDGGEYLMGKRNCHPHSGSYAGWTVGGGADGSLLACDSTYPNNARTWAVYGPFSLEGYSSATLVFYLYGTSEYVSDQCPNDFLYVGSSVDGTNFLGGKACGDATDGPDGNGYYRLTFDLNDRLGQSQVWIAFLFASNASVVYSGFIVDDISIELSGGPGTTSTPTSTPTTPPTRTPTPTFTSITPAAGARIYLPVIAKGHIVAGGTMRNSRGQPAEALSRSEALFADFSGLAPRTQYDIRVLSPNGSELTRSRLTSDANGRIPNSALAYDLGLTMSGRANLDAAAIGYHTIIILDRSGRELRRWIVQVREPTGPVIYASDSQGNALNSFLVNAHSVYARGEGFPPGAQVRLYVVSDRSDWRPGTTLADVTGWVETATAGPDGKFLVQVSEPLRSIGPYDIVADVDRDGQFSNPDVVDGYLPVGFVVQRLGTQAHIQVQLACDVNLNYKDAFLTTENVYFYVNPPVQQFTHVFGFKYIVRHRDNWVGGEDLIDITEGPERDNPQFGCTNQYRVLVWPALLTPGVYDAVFDINANGRYDVGIDLLDNIDAFGNPVGGFFVPGELNAPVVRITSPADGSSDPDGVIMLEGTITSGSPLLGATWYVNAGTQSNQGYLTVSQGRFSQQIYLFPGQNTVQVWARNEAGSGTARIVVNSAVSGVWDIHAQLVWDINNIDVDLHLLRPGGARNSSTGDCYYSNCRNEDRARNPDWGRIGQADDNPRLDVDCVSGCTGPENITLRTMDRSEANGRYTVEAYYYGGSGTVHPRLNLWVRGQLYTFGPVNLNYRQWWTVCTIDWPSGLVTGSGVIGSAPFAAPEDAEERFPPVKESKTP